MSKTTRLDKDAWAIATEIARQSGLSNGRTAIEAVLRLHGPAPLKTGGQCTSAPLPVQHLMPLREALPVAYSAALDNENCPAMADINDVLGL